MGVLVMPEREKKRRERLCQGAVNLAELAEKRQMPVELVEYLKEAFKVNKITANEPLPRILKYASNTNKATTTGSNKKLELATFENAEFLNCLIGTERNGFEIGQYCSEKLESALNIEMADNYTNCSKNRKDEISEHATKIVNNNANGMHVTFNHWTDLALEMWGNSINADRDLKIKLMIVGKDAYNVDGMRNALFHQYYGKISTWRNLWTVQFKTKDRKKLYDKMSQHIKEDGNTCKICNQLLASKWQSEICDGSEIGKRINEWQVWATNAVPYLRTSKSPVGKLSEDLENDKLAIALLSYQIWLLQPAKIIVLGNSKHDALAFIITKKAAELIFGQNASPKITRIPHPSSPHLVNNADATRNFIENLPS